MNIANSPCVGAATAAASRGETGDAVNILVLRKALNLQAASALALIDGLGAPPTRLATEGPLGTQLDTYA